uniref:Structural ORF n=1 Tax=Ambidensovirus sp. TaxID=2050976 RepID=A0A2Z4EVI5_9VIRU|nr:Structural ORF [Ambidensovirus sp.]
MVREQGPPPHLRPNWHSLNKGQRLYAIRQYNVGRRNRGLPEIPYDTLTAHVQRYVSDNSSGGGGEEEQPGSSGVSDSTNTDNAFENQSYDSDSVFENSSSTDNDIRMANVSGSKRGPETADSSSDPKRARQDGMALPGTGGTPDGDPDTGNPSPENAVIPRPINRIGGHKLVFRKHHCLLSYGLAWKISRLNATSKHYLTTTSLMSLPVEYPFFYLSPTEWNWVKEIRGLKVESVKCKVVMRNPRTAFETNSSSTTLATLNQNKFLATATGLNIQTRGIDRSMKFGSGGESMVNQGTEEYSTAKMKEFIKAAYGGTTKSPEFGEGFDFVPCSFNYLPMLHNRYFCAVAANNDVNKDIGWPDLTQYIVKQDASFMTGKTILDYEYKPKYGLLGQPHQMRLNGYFGNEDAAGYEKNHVLLMSRERNPLGQVFDTNIESGDMVSKQTNIIDVEMFEWDALTGPSQDMYMTPIEKSQYVWKGPHVKDRSKIQPSLHCGIYPVARLTTSDLTTVPKKFTDVEMLWDIDCEMECSYDFDTMNLTHYDKPYLVPFEHATYINKLTANSQTYFQQQYSTVNGEYVTRKATT